MTLDSRAVKSAQALLKALRDGAALPLELADQLREMLPRRKRGGQAGSKKAGSASSRGDIIAAIYATEMKRGASAAKAAAIVRKRLRMQHGDRALRAAMREYLKPTKASVELLLKSIDGGRAEAAEGVAELHHLISKLPREQHAAAYELPKFVDVFAAAVEAFMKNPSDETRSAIDAVRSAMPDALRAKLGTLKL